MKHYHFMNKPDVVEAEDYENPDGYATFYYKRKERIANRRKLTGPSCQTQSPLLRKFRPGKGRKMMYLVNIVVIVIMFIVWNAVNKQDSSVFVEEKTWRYYIKLTPMIVGLERELSLYVQNVSPDKTSLRRSYRFIFFDGKDDGINKRKARKVQINKDFNPKETYRLATLVFEGTKDPVIDHVGVYINDDITLTRPIQAIKE